MKNFTYVLLQGGALHPTHTSPLPVAENAMMLGPLTTVGWRSKRLAPQSNSQEELLMPTIPADERKVNQVLARAERIARNEPSDNHVYSGDIVQFPVSIAHVYEAVMGAEMGEESDVHPRRQVCDHVMAKVIESAWEGAKGNKGQQVLVNFAMALRNHIRDIQLILDTTSEQQAKDYKFKFAPNEEGTPVPLCPYCSEPMETLEANHITEEEGVTVDFSQDDSGRLEYTGDAMDDGDCGGSTNYADLACSSCGVVLPEFMQKHLVSAYSS